MQCFHFNVGVDQGHAIAPVARTEALERLKLTTEVEIALMAL